MNVPVRHAIARVALTAPLFLLPAAASGDDGNISYEAGVNIIALTASDSRVRNDATASADLRLYWARPHGRWTLYLEGNTTPRDDGVSTVIGESNADAGTALDEARRGRVQISELFYTHEWKATRSVVAGLIDASAYLDTSRIANDENTQFLGVSFVNNPTIEFPDYALGVVYEERLAVAGKPVLRAIITASNGLSDNPNVSYSQLLNVDDPSKGAFIALRAGWKGPTALFNLGAWTHTAPHTALDNPARTDLRNYGAYAVVGALRERHALNLRLGAANPEVFRAQAFAALSYRYKHDPWVTGIGYAHIRLSNYVADPAQDNARHSEVYLRYQYATGRFVTASAQHIVNSNFDSSATVYDRGITLLGLRWTLLW